MDDTTGQFGQTTNKTDDAELQEFVRSRIEGLRPKLLDLSRRNPLISTRFSHRSTSYIRVVDELPDVLWYSLENQKRMRFIPLPPLDDDPRDEQTTVFQDALAEARLTDEAYLAAVDAIDADSDTALEQNRQLERALKDRLRELLAMPARQTKSDVSLPQHARNNHISPSYQLPQPDMALLANEISKKQRYIPVRDLTTRSGRALLELKSCWMMSPLAIAQYLPRSEQKFDLCIIDEASQMPPEDSVGALARSHQAIVVGDSNQLPPTNFFRKMIEDEDTEDETVLDESILEMANSAFRPKRRLRWHYRSRHSGLIKFSNHMIYNDDLVVFPNFEPETTRLTS